MPMVSESVAQPSSSRNLSSREENILRCLTSGLSNKVIARRLSLSEATVKGHIKVIMRKINAQNRTQAAIWGLANGLEESNNSGPN
jgi:two-component system nitrate/nitrite response regulator NarL